MTEIFRALPPPSASEELKTGARPGSKTAVGRVAITGTTKATAAGAATIGTAIGFTAAYLTVDGVQEGGFLNQLGEHIQENVDVALETVENLLS